MGIIRYVDDVTPVGTDGVYADSVYQPIPITPNCSPPCDEVIQGEIICNLANAWNNNLCVNDTCYTNPVIPGDCLYFQFQFQNTRNAKGSISWYQYLQRAFPKIPYTWYHNSLNPTDWTIRAKIINACTGADYNVPSTTNNYADVFMKNAGIFLSQDRKASAKTLPANSWYKWVQNGIFCIPSTLPANFPPQFYFSFEIKNFAGVSSFVFSQVYDVDTCNNTILLEGSYSLKDCFGYDYSIPLDNPLATPSYGIGTPFNQVVNSSFLVLNSERGYRNVHRIRGNAEYVGRLIEKDIPERQCLSIKTSVKEQYRLRLKPLPPYVAEIVNNNLSGQLAYLTGVANKGLIEVQPNAGATKDNDISNMWLVDITLNGCECLDYHQC